MDSLINPAQWRLSNPDLLQNIALLTWLNKDNKEMMKWITGLRVGYELYSRVSCESEIETCQMLCYAAIADFIKKNPKATEQQIAAEVAKQVELFKARIEAL